MNKKSIERTPEEWGDIATAIDLLVEQFKLLEELMRDLDKLWIN